MLVIAPIVILALGGFIALMVSMVGDVIASRDQNVIMYESQDALNRIEDDVHLSTAFLTTTGTLSTPQGSNSNFTGNAAFSNSPNTLILNTYLTDRSPSDSARDIIYYKAQPNACDDQRIFNNVLYAHVIYFIKDGSLWRRTVIPPYNTNVTTDSQTVCAAPWQQNSCSPGYTPGPRCQTNDIEVMKNIGTMTIEYYATPGGTTSLGTTEANAASTIKVILVGQKQSAGRAISNTSSLRATRLNAAIVP